MASWVWLETSGNIFQSHSHSQSHRLFPILPLPVAYYYSVSRKKRPKCFFVISSTKLGRFRWNVVQGILQEKVYKTWSGWTETATENGVGQAGWCRHCSSNSSMASLIAADHWSMSCNISHTVLSTGFKYGEFAGDSWGGINSGVSPSNNSIVACAQWTFQVSQGSVETLFRWGGNVYMILWQIYSGKYVPRYITIARVL